MLLYCTLSDDVDESSALLNIEPAASPPERRGGTDSDVNSVPAITMKIMEACDRRQWVPFQFLITQL